jgi:plastocyanin
MRSAITFLTLLLCAAALALAGCGGGGNKSSSSTPSGGGAATSGGGASTSGGGASTSGGGGASGQGAGGSVAVTMQNIAFSPKTITVKVGQKITWTNEDSVPHNVLSKSGEKISSPTFTKGGTFSFTPTKAGTISYVCTIHPGMEGTIVVQK